MGRMHRRFLSITTRCGIADALYLFAGLAGYQQSWNADAAAGDGLAGRCEAQNTGDEYLFGPAILVSPVTTEGATSRTVYLPQATWYDFWTGDKQEGGKRIQADAPLEKMPLFVRAGSIIPMGPAMEWTTEKPADPIEVRVYPGRMGILLSMRMRTMGTAMRRVRMRRLRCIGTTLRRR